MTQKPATAACKKIMEIIKPLRGEIFSPRGMLSRVGKIGAYPRIKLELVDTFTAFLPNRFAGLHARLNAYRQLTITLSKEFYSLREYHKNAELAKTTPLLLRKLLERSDHLPLVTQELVAAEEIGLRLKNELSTATQELIAKQHEIMTFENELSAQQRGTVAMQGELDSLTSIIQTLVQPEINKVFESIILGVQKLGYKRGFLYEHDPHTRKFRMVMPQEGRYVEPKDPDELGDWPKSQARETKQIVFVPDPIKNEPPQLVIPLVVEGEVVGGLKIDNLNQSPLYKEGVNPETMNRILTAFANMAAVAMKNASLIKEIKKARFNFEEAMTQARLGEVIKMLGHHLNNNLTNIDLSLQLFNMQIGKILSAKRLNRKAIAAIQNDLPGMSESVAKLTQIRTLLQPYLFPITETKKMPLRETIEAAIGKAKLFASKNGVLFEVAQEGDAAFIVGSRELEFALQQIFKNSIEAINARRAAGSKSVEGTVRIKTSRRNGNVLLMVEDNGIGIPDQQMKKIFDPFISGDAKDAKNNFGLGLSYAKQVIEALQGSIQLTSSPEGTTVLIELPVAN